MKQITRVDPAHVVRPPRGTAETSADGREVTHRDGSHRAWMTDEDYAVPGAKIVTNWEGRRCQVMPMHYIDGEPFYPRYDLPPGPKRSEIEQAMMSDYRNYRDKKKGRK